jgi:hypothetical protein
MSVDMALLKRQLCRQRPAPTSKIEDVWSLVFETETRFLYVEHEWDDVEKDQGSKDDKDRGVIKRRVKVPLDGYLGSMSEGLGQRELVRLIMTLFE